MEYESNGLEMKDFPFGTNTDASKNTEPNIDLRFPIEYNLHRRQSVIKMVKSCDFHENPLNGVSLPYLSGASVTQMM